MIREKATGHDRWCGQGGESGVPPLARTERKASELSHDLEWTIVGEHLAHGAIPE